MDRSELPRDKSEDGAPGDAASLTSIHEMFTTFWVGLVFFGLMVGQERVVLDVISGGDALPYLMWRSLWPLLLIALSLLLPMRPRILLLASSGLVWSLIAVGDAVNFRFFGSITSMVSIGTIHQLFDVRDSVIDVLRTKDWLFSLGFVALGLTALLPRWVLIGSETTPMPLRQRRVSAGAVGSVLVLFTVGAWLTPIYEDTHHIGRDKWVMPYEHWGSRFSFTAYANTFGLYNYHIHDMLDFLDFGRDRSSMTDERLAQIDSVVDRKRALNKIETPLQGIAKGRRVVLIQLEAIVHWLVDMEHDGTKVMPFLASLTEKGLSWDYVMDVTAMGRTSDAEFAVMTGLLPDTSRPNSFANSDKARDYLPRTLKDMGYSTASYHGYKMSFWNRTYTHPVYGFDESFFDTAYDSREVLGLGVPDRVVYDFMTDRIERDPGPSLSFMISLSSHHPFVYTPASYNALFPSVTIEGGYGLLGPYLRCARYTDDALKDFFRDMEERGLAEDTIFVIYGDHDSGYLHTDKTLPNMSPFAYTVAEERVPFIVVVPGQEEVIAEHREAHTDATAGLQDTFPTLMHLLGEPVPDGVLGTNMLVPEQFRDPVPLLSRLGDLLFAYRKCIHTSRGSGCVNPAHQAQSEPLDQLPTLIEGIRDQVMVRELLDHPEYWDRARESTALETAMVPPSAGS